MAVTRPWDAREALRRLLGHEQVPLRHILADPYLPPRFEAGDDQPFRLLPDDLIGGYGNESRYTLDGSLSALIAGPADVAARSGEHLSAYAQASLDLTMQGGTTSGVVYPLATCELATRFRFRNVGGASAGAIAASFTAAAELGRSEPARGRALVAAPTTTDPIPAPVLRRGFPGLADVMAWLTQTGPGDGGADEYRLAQLFRPGAAARDTFRVLVAVMRGRGWPLPFLALSAFGRWTVAATIAVLVLTVVGTSSVGEALSTTSAPWYVALGWGALGTAAYVGTVIAVVLIGQALLTVAARRRQRRRESRRTGTPLGLLQHVTSSAPVKLNAASAVALATAVVLFGGAVTLAVFAAARYLAAWIVGLAGSFLVALIFSVALWRYVDRFRTETYGLIAGTEPSHPLTWLDRLAHVPNPTVVLSLVPWLSNSLSQLAGLPTGAVLRFGHLWDGADYRAPGTDRGEDDRLRWERQSRVKDARLVNLELMTTDVTRRRPYRFPLPVDEQTREPLYLRLDQLAVEGVFPAEVLAALGETDSVSAQIDGETEPVLLHRLPPPWDLPVVVAVRLSMSLPALFQPVRMYRLRGDHTVRDDFGRPVLLDGIPLTRATVQQPLPADGSAPAPPAVPLAEELWLSDGGITSNFPVHFFDAPLPRWPTVSLNLGAFPEVEPMQDVWLPQDWEPVSIPAEPLGRSGFSLAAAIVDTAMSWRDSMQSALPGYRNRIAQVRTRADEGGLNLFMSRDTIASLALRGAFAGARLRTRFGEDREWDRFRWLRLRVALSNLERLREDTDRRQPYYADALAGAQWLADAEEQFLGGRPAPAGLSWFAPPPSFWPEAGNFLTGFATAHSAADPNPLLVNAPEPQPALRQVPQE